MFYVPLAQSVTYKNDLMNGLDRVSHFISGVMLVTNQPPGALEPVITKALAEVDPDLTIVSVRTLEQQLALSFDRERAVRKHIGDYTLFLAGLFPEYVASLPRSGLRLDAFVDYLKAGKESYRIVSFFDQFEYRNEAPLFRRLSDQFECCVYGLNLVQQDLASFQQDHYRRLKAAFE